MPNLIVVTREGAESTIDAAIGRSVMEAIRDNGFDEWVALCGGCLSCATCHVYVDETTSAEAAAGVRADESELLESSDHRRANSRLSCQIRMSDALDGLRVTIAPED